MKETLTGTFKPISSNNHDGFYPKNWDSFTVMTSEGKPNVHLTAGTGGRRDEWLKLEGQTVSVQATFVEGQNLALGSPATVKPVDLNL